LAADFLASATLRGFDGETRFLVTAFFTARRVDFLAAAACLPFRLIAIFLEVDFFAERGAAVIFPGRFGFLAAAFFAFVARIFWDFEKPLLVALVIKLLISILEVENQLAFPSNPCAHSSLCVFYINNLSASQENTSTA